MSVKITTLELENVKKIKAVQLTPQAVKFTEMISRKIGDVKI